MDDSTGVVSGHLLSAASVRLDNVSNSRHTSTTAFRPRPIEPSNEGAQQPRASMTQLEVTTPIMAPKYTVSPAIGFNEPQWTANLDNLVLQFRDKCSKRILLHRESAHYYARQLRYFTIPGGMLGALGSSTVFAMWKGELCNEPWHQWTLLGSGVCMLLSTALGALVSKSQYPALYAAHIKSYRQFDKLLKKLTVELSFEPHMRQPVREFIQEMIADYDRYTDEAELAPRAVEAAVQQMLLEAEQRAAADALVVLEAQSGEESALNEAAGMLFSNGRRRSSISIVANSSSAEEQQQWRRRTSRFQRDPESTRDNETRLRQFSSGVPPSAEKSSPRTSNDNKEQPGENFRSVRFAGYNQMPRARSEAEQQQASRLAAQSHRRRIARQYCKRMPFTSIIEMGSPTYEEQISASTNASNSQPHTDSVKSLSDKAIETGGRILHATQGAQTTATNGPGDIDRLDKSRYSRGKRQKNKARKQPSAETRHRMGSVAGGEDVHSELVQSAVASGMNDITASHLSDNNDSKNDEEEPRVDQANSVEHSCDSCDSRKLDQTLATSDATQVVVETRKV